jgi:hypothetical protein
MKMKVYKVTEKDGNEKFYADSYSVEHKKTTINIFVMGKGIVKFPRKKVAELEIEVAEKWSYAELRRILDDHGEHVAKRYAERKLPCAECCIRSYLYIAKQSKDPAFMDELAEKAGFEVYRHTSNVICFGIFLFPIAELDDWLKTHHGYTEEDHGSMKDFCTFKWGQEFTDKLELSL